MKNYVKPMIMLNEEYAEGVFAASGDLISDCMTVDFLPGTRVEGVPSGTKIDFRFQYNHIAYDHCNHGCHIRAVFPCNINVVEVTAGVTMDGNGTSCIDFYIPNPLHAAGNNTEKSDLVIAAIVASADEAALVYALTTATISDEGLRDSECPTHKHMYH